MIGCLRTNVRKQPIIALYFESETVLKFITSRPGNATVTDQDVERADLLALVCGVFCEFVTFPLVSWVRCGP